MRARTRITRAHCAAAAPHIRTYKQVEPRTTLHYLGCDWKTFFNTLPLDQDTA